MLYAIWEINGEEYKLRLTTFQAVQVERQLGMGLTETISHLADVTVITTILWGALQQYNHGLNLRDVCDLYDEYLENGGSIEKIMDVMMEILAQVGIGERSERKNAKGQKEKGKENIEA